MNLEIRTVLHRYFNVGFRRCHCLPLNSAPLTPTVKEDTCLKKLLKKGE